MENNCSNTRTYAIMAKPVGARCNLRCTYCYYLEKAQLAPQPPLMSQEVLAAYIRHTLALHGQEATVEFAWHGGEPTLAGLEFYREAVRLEKQYGAGRRIKNTMQTNGTLLDEAWCEFLATEGFLLGVSVDGPPPLHEANRGAGRFEQLLRSLELLRRYQVPYNTLTTINAANVGQPLAVYDYLCTLTDHLQFLPVVEGLPALYEAEDGQRFTTPAGCRSAQFKARPAPGSITAEQFGAFLCAVFERWLARDYGRKWVQLFEAAVGNTLGLPPGLCVHEATCGHAACLEANGDLYSCDCYVYPEYRLGNILEEPLGELMERNREFGLHKAYKLAPACLVCPHLHRCYGGCPKDRLPSGQSVLCAGYRQFFDLFMDKLGSKLSQ